MENDDETPQRSKRQRTAKSFGDDFIVYLMDDTPSSISEAYASSDAVYWKETVRSEMDSILYLLIGGTVRASTVILEVMKFYPSN
jgi:hypothetical protein